MPRAPEADTAAIDGFDAVLTFAYAYAAEDARGQGLATLRAWAAQLTDRVHQSDIALAFLVTDAQRAVSSAVTSVLNTLYDAVRNGGLGPPVDFDRAWLNKPAVLTGAHLDWAHRTQREDIETVILALRLRLDDALSPETKPYVTAEQVAAILRHLQLGPTIPIHVDTLARLMERSVRRDPTSFHAEASRLGQIAQMADRYVKEAEVALVQMVRDQFIQEAAAALYPDACRLKVSLDKVFPWGALWQPPPSGAFLLALYARLNGAAVIVDRKFRDTAARSGTLPSDGMAFGRWVRAEVPVPRSTEPSNASFRSTAMTTIQIADDPLVDSAVMTVRYDRPLPDLKRTFGFFTNYVLSQRQRYCKEVGIDPDPAERALLKKLAAKRDAGVALERRVLHDKSSILGHVVGIMDAELTREGPPDGLRKLNHQTLYEQVRQAGFTFSQESIRKACDRFTPTRDAVYRQLVGHAPRSTRSPSQDASE